MLNVLHLPFCDKLGWPWTEESQCLPETMPDGIPWPRISIITPSYNQGQFLEETIRSVLLQGYPNLEYIIIDGGSTDNSVEIIKKYESWLSYWVSEPDEGQSHAINKGFQRARGEILAWINSDDTYKPGVFLQVVSSFARFPEAWVVYGDADFVSEAGNSISCFGSQEFNSPKMFFEHFIPQPSAFIRKQAIDRIGLLDDKLHFCMDYEFWLRIAMEKRLEYVQACWSNYRIHSRSKSTNLQALRWGETSRILVSFFSRSDIPTDWRRYKNDAIGRARWHASIEYFKLENAQEAVEQAVQASLYAPEYIQSQGFAMMFVGSKATRVASNSIEKTENYFNLLPETIAHKKKGRLIASSRARALLALNPSVERKQASEYARWAIWHDFTWLANRHVVRRAIGI